MSSVFFVGCSNSARAPGTFVFNLFLPRCIREGYAGICLTPSYVTTRPQHLRLSKMKNQEGHNWAY